jgi:hypothetical protein
MAGYTTEALFMRVPGINQEGSSIERWKRIQDTPENKQLDNTVEYSGGVLEQFVESSADDASTDDFIRFKIFPIDSSQGGLQDVDSLRGYIQHSNENAQNFVYRDGEYYLKNPVYAENLISEKDAQIIMGDDAFTFTQNEFNEHMEDNDEDTDMDEDPYEDFDDELDEAIIRNDSEYFGQVLDELFNEDNSFYVSRLTTEDDPREEFTIRNGRRNGTIWQSIFSHHRLEMYETMMQFVVLMCDPRTPETWYEEKAILIEDLVELAIFYDWPEFLDVIGSEMVMAIAQGKSVIPNRNIFDELQLDAMGSARFDTPDCYTVGGQYIHGNPERIINRTMRRWLRFVIHKDAAGAFVWLTENLKFIPLTIDSMDFIFRSSEDNRNRRFREYAESEGARNVVAALNEM